MDFVMKDMMVKKRIALGILLLIFGTSSAADISDVDLLYRFLRYTGEFYLKDQIRSLEQDDISLTTAQKIYSARILGYSIGNLLQYARRGSEEHKTWVKLDELTQNLIKGLIDQEGVREGWSKSYIDERKKNAQAQYLFALQGWTEALLIRQTHVYPKDAPNFFKTMRVTAGDSVGGETETRDREPERGGRGFTSQLKTVRDKEYADRLSKGMGAQDRDTARSGEQVVDAVAGIYEIITNQPVRTEITISGWMHRVDTEFKLWDQGRLTWHFKGTAKWDGAGLQGDARDLHGSVQNQLGNDRQAVKIGIQRHNDGIWRAIHYTLGSHHQIRQTRADVPKERVRVLVIRNQSRVKVRVYLGPKRESPGRLLGSVDRGRSELYEDLPERGMWHLLIEPDAPNTPLKSFTRTLDIKEGEYDYVFEVRDRDFL